MGCGTSIYPYSSDTIDSIKEKYRSSFKYRKDTVTNFKLFKLCTDFPKNVYKINETDYIVYDDSNIHNVWLSTMITLSVKYITVYNDVIANNIKYPIGSRILDLSDSDTVDKIGRLYMLEPYGGVVKFFIIAVFPNIEDDIIIEINNKPVSMRYMLYSPPHKPVEEYYSSNNMYTKLSFNGVVSFLNKLKNV